MTWLQTASGVAFDLRHPTPDQVVATDLAHALSQLCRYAGHTRVHYSVAEHCVLLHDWVLAEYKSPDLALAALLHDGHEAYINDIPAPVKWVLPIEARRAYSEIGDRIDRAIALRFELGPALLHDRRIKLADVRILLDERDAVLGPPARDWEIEGPPLGVTVHGWAAPFARAAWLGRLVQHRPGAVPC